MPSLTDLAQVGRNALVMAYKAASALDLAVKGRARSTGLLARSGLQHAALGGTSARQGRSSSTGRARLWPAACGHGDCSCRTSRAALAYRLARAGSGRLDSAAGTRSRSSASKIARARSRRATAAGKSPFWTVA